MIIIKKKKIFQRVYEAKIYLKKKRKEKNRI